MSTIELLKRQGRLPHANQAVELLSVLGGRHFGAGDGAFCKDALIGLAIALWFLSRKPAPPPSKPASLTLTVNSGAKPSVTADESWWRDEVPR